jgi:hypothetical protein
MHRIPMGKAMKDAIRTLTAAAVVIFAALVHPGQAAATTVDQFIDKMSDDEENVYVLTMTRAAEKSLNDAGKPELARRVETLFADGERSGGGLEFAKTVLAFFEQETGREAVGEKSEDRPFLVEEMMVRELQRHQIAVPPSFMAAAKAGKLKEMAAKQGALPAPPVPSRPAASDDDPIGSGGFITPPKK